MNRVIRHHFHRRMNNIIRAKSVLISGHWSLNPNIFCIFVESNLCLYFMEEMKGRTINPEVVDYTNKTVVTVIPCSQDDLSVDEWAYPCASVRVDYLVNSGHLLFSATFRKLLDGTPFGGDCFDDNAKAASEKADDLINGDLSAIGLEGLYNLDVYRYLVDREVTLIDRNDETVKEIISSSLNLPFIAPETIVAKLVPPVDGFYNFAVNWYCK